MFNELVDSVVVRRATNKGWGFLVSLTLQAACLFMLILVPLIWTQALPKAILGTFLVAPAAPAATPPAAPATATLTRNSVRIFHDGIVNEPVAIPKHAEIFVEPPLPPETAAGYGVPGGYGGDLLGIIDDEATRQFPAPPASPAVLAPERTQPQRIQKGGEIQAAQLISRVQPVYPVLARQSGIQGVVVLHAIIARDGGVNELQVISGHPLLVKAALDAVSQWRYQPTLLNGQPVEVETTITVSFVLGG
jgi:periplasmic protein TonB